MSSHYVRSRRAQARRDYVERVITGAAMIFVITGGMWLVVYSALSPLIQSSRALIAWFL